MHFARTAVWGSAIVASLAFAQATNTADGTYEVTIPFPSKPVVADLVLNGETGSFRSHFGGGKNNKCGSHDTPVAVRSATADELRLTIEYSKVMPGCNDLRFNVKRSEGDTYTGTWPDTREGRFEAVVVKKK